MQPSLLVCLLAASAFGGRCRSSAESAPDTCIYWWDWSISLRGDVASVNRGASDLGGGYELLLRGSY